MFQVCEVSEHDTLFQKCTEERKWVIGREMCSGSMCQSVLAQHGKVGKRIFVVERKGTQGHFLLPKMTFIIQNDSTEFMGFETRVENGLWQLGLFNHNGR